MVFSRMTFARFDGAAHHPPDNEREFPKKALL
jgi:hypothetical protein